MTHILHLDASARHDGSLSRQLSAAIAARFPGAEITRRDLAAGLPFVDAAWVGATFTAPDARSEAQRAALAFSDTLVDELVAADILIIGTPIYNFGLPAVLKAWIDQIARVHRSFHYTATGPVGLLTGKRAIIGIASGGTQVGSEIDFASGYLRHILGFVGIDDVTVIAADQHMGRGPAALENALAQIGELAV